MFLLFGSSGKIVVSNPYCTVSIVMLYFSSYQRKLRLMIFLTESLNLKSKIKDSERPMSSKTNAICVLNERLSRAEVENKSLLRKLSKNMRKITLRFKNKIQQRT